MNQLLLLLISIITYFHTLLSEVLRNLFHYSIS
jgi:hypothetical protein